MAEVHFNLLLTTASIGSASHQVIVAENNKGVTGSNQKAGMFEVARESVTYNLPCCVYTVYKMVNQNSHDFGYCWEAYIKHQKH